MHKITESLLCGVVVLGVHRDTNTLVHVLKRLSTSLPQTYLLPDFLVVFFPPVYFYCDIIDIQHCKFKVYLCQ